MSGTFRDKDPGSESPADPEVRERATLPLEGGSSHSSDSPAVTLGPYRILEEIGRGGMGVVYRAFHGELKREVALKVLIAGEDASEEAIERFHREAESVAKLGHHPNIVPVYDIGREGARHYFAMHFVEGSPLDRLIDEEALNSKLAARLLEKVARGLQHAHDHDVLHRDIKPANILVTPDFEPLITDFGLAKDVRSESSMTRSGVTLGTPQYMPPEQADGRLDDVDTRSDVYSLGSTLYETLTFRPPFEGNTPINVVRKVIFDDPFPPRRIDPSVDPALETICLKCLEKDPDRRYASALALAEDLGRYLDGIPIEARPASLTEKLVKKIRRHKVASIGIAVAAAAIVFGGVIALAGVLGGLRKERQAQGDVKKARQDEARAISEKETAELSLDKGRKVARVLLGAHSKLGRVQTELKTAYYSSSFSLEGRRKSFERRKNDIDAFLARVPDDTASRATAMAVEGWLLFHGGYEREGITRFREAQNLDGEVAWVFFLEAMFWLGDYLMAMNTPATWESSSGLTFRPHDFEKKRMVTARVNFEALMKKADEAPIWGEELSEEFPQVLEMIRSLQENDPARAAEGLTTALSIWEMAWLEEELLFGRAKLLYSLQRFDEALADMAVLQERCPDESDVHGLIGQILTSKATVALTQGTDPVKLLMDSARAYARAVELEPGNLLFLSGQGCASYALGRAEGQRGGDPRPHMKRAGILLAKVVEGMPDSPENHLNLGIVSSTLAQWKVRRGLDSGEEITAALEAFGAAQRIDPDMAHPYNSRGLVHTLEAFKAGLIKRDPHPHLAKAIADFDMAIVRKPDFLDARANRGLALLRRGDVEWFRKGDYLVTYRKAMEDFEEVLKVDGDHVPAWMGMGQVHRRLGEDAVTRDRDPLDSFRKANTFLEEALKRNPNHVEVLSNSGIVLIMLAMAEAATAENPMPNFRRAEARLGKAARIDRDYWLHHFQHGKALGRLGRYKDAADALDRAKRLAVTPNKDLIDTLALLGRVMSLDPWVRRSYFASRIMRAGAYEASRKVYEESVATASKTRIEKGTEAADYLSTTHYNLACIHAVAARGQKGPAGERVPPEEKEKRRRVEAALEHIQKAMDWGWKDIEGCLKDSDLEAIHDHPRLRTMLETRREKSTK